MPSPHEYYAHWLKPSNGFGFRCSTDEFDIGHCLQLASLRLQDGFPNRSLRSAIDKPYSGRLEAIEEILQTATALILADRYGQSLPFDYLDLCPESCEQKY
jgi:lambda repressor-like predicted transcriptional regulator